MRRPWLQSLDVPLAIFAVVVSLLVIGLIGVYSASSSMAGYDKIVRERPAAELAAPPTKYHDTYYLKRQLMWAGLGLVEEIGDSRSR